MNVKICALLVLFVGAGCSTMAPIHTEATTAKSLGQSIRGECEMSIDGESEIQPCTDIRLIAHAVRGGEERVAVIEGFNFKIDDLNEELYGLEASSPTYDVRTDSKELSPGQVVRILVRASVHETAR